MASESKNGRGWRPEADDKIAGEVIDISMTDGGYGSYYIITIRDAQGDEHDIHAFHTVLRNELARRNVQIGDTISVQFCGMVDGGQGSRGYAHYRVTGGKTPVVNWSGEAGGEVVLDGATQVESDAPIDLAGLPEPPARSIAERAREAFGDEPPFDE